MNTCPFCDYKNDELSSLLFENELCICIQLHHKILIGSCMVMPKEHKVTVFDLSSEEWEATYQLMQKTKSYLDSKYNPGGYNVGWNCGATAG